MLEPAASLGYISQSASLWKPPGRKSRKGGTPMEAVLCGSRGRKRPDFRTGAGAIPLRFWRKSAGSCWASLNPAEPGSVGIVSSLTPWNATEKSTPATPAEDFFRQIRTPIPGSNNPLYWSLESSTEMRILSWSATAGNQSEPPMLDREGARRKRGQGDTPWRVHVPAR